MGWQRATGRYARRMNLHAYSILLPYSLDFHDGLLLSIIVDYVHYAGHFIYIILGHLMTSIMRDILYI